MYGTGEKPSPTINGCYRAGTVDVGQAERGPEEIEGDAVDKLDGKKLPAPYK